MVSACNGHDWHIAESLLDLYGPEAAHVRGIGEYDCTPLHAAAATGQLPLLQQLLRAGAHVDVPAMHAFTPLFMAVRNNRPAATAMLLAAGADPDIVCAGTTPLLVAADAGFGPVVAALLRGGASTFATDERGDTALHLACSNGHVNVVQMLLEAGADPTVGNAMAISPLHMAEESGDVELVEMMRSPKMALVASDSYGRVVPYQSDMYTLDLTDPSYSMGMYPYDSPYHSMDMMRSGYGPYALDTYSSHYGMGPYSSYYSSAYGPYAMDSYSRYAIDRYGLDRYTPYGRSGYDRFGVDRYSSVLGRYGLMDPYSSPYSGYGRSRYGGYMDKYSRFGPMCSYSRYDMSYGYGPSRNRRYGSRYGGGYGRYSMYDRMGYDYDGYGAYGSRSLSPSRSDWSDDWHSPAYGGMYGDDYYRSSMGPYGGYRYGGAYGYRGGRGRLTSRERYRMRGYRSDDIAEMIGSFVGRSLSYSERSRFMNRVERNAHRYRVSGSTLLSDRYGAETLARMLVTDSSGHARGDELWSTAEFIRSFRDGGSYAY
ncbi:Ankyrin repeat containing protein [Gracilaria domingensis]|nr:Ankyrin repeat containing protein [Gracilaria domingensis]